MRRIFVYLPLLTLLLFCIPFASGQSAVDINLGFGGAHASANKGGIDNGNSITNPPRVITDPCSTGKHSTISTAFTSPLARNVILCSCKAELAGPGPVSQ